MTSTDPAQTAAEGEHILHTQLSEPPTKLQAAHLYTAAQREGGTSTSGNSPCLPVLTEEEPHPATQDRNVLLVIDRGPRTCVSQTARKLQLPGCRVSGQQVLQPGTRQPAAQPAERIRQRVNNATDLSRGSNQRRLAL